ncbi:MAG TPA: dihydrofolate reductase [Thermoanaerobaculia bacterium]|nr:dihydrofolate reductase [Thermoanaerobaculia bacterium]
MSMKVSIIAAVSTNGVIGRDNQVPWCQRTDLKRYRALTMGHHLITGRKTYESVGKPLPGRKTVVITRDPNYRADGVLVVHTLDEALRVAEAAGDSEAFINGGAEIYAQSLHRADRMHLTRIHAEVEGDTFFPDFDDAAEWQLTDSEHFEADEKNDHPYSFLTYDRVRPAGHPIPDEG